MDNKDNSFGLRRKKDSYQHSLVDLRFLKVVDLVIEKNKRAKIKPYTDNSISETVFGYRQAIAKIRTDPRGVTLSQIEKFAIYFNLDFNCFFRDTATIEYDPKNIGRQTTAYKKGIAAGDNASITLIDGDLNGEIIDKINNIHNGNRIDQFIHEAKTVINHKLSDEQWENILESIKTESENLRKMVTFYQAQFHTANEKCKTLEKERDEARQGEREITKKYMSLLEKQNENG